MIFFLYKNFNCNLKIFKNELVDRQCLLSIKQCLSLNKAKIDIFLKCGRYIELKKSAKLATLQFPYILIRTF